MNTTKPVIDSHQSELARGLVAGNPDCFANVYHLYAKKIYGVARSFYLGHDDAEEMVQEVFIKLWKNKGNIDPNLSLEAYLATITKNTTLKFLRSKSTRMYYLMQSAERNVTMGNCVENTINYQELLSRLNEILDQVSPQRRKVFQMIRLEGMKVEEVAKKMKLSRRTIEHHLYHATKFIRAALNFLLLVLLSTLGGQ